MSKSLKEGLLIALATAVLTISGSFLVIRAGVINDLRTNKADRSELQELEKKKADKEVVEKELTDLKENNNNEHKNIRNEIDSKNDQIMKYLQSIDKKVEILLSKK